MEISTTPAHRDLFPQTLYRFIKLYLNKWMLILNIILCYIYIYIYIYIYMYVLTTLPVHLVLKKPILPVHPY